MYFSDSIDSFDLSPCSHKKKDYKTLPHCASVRKGKVDKAIIFTADASVFVIATTFFRKVSFNEIGIEFGKSTSKR